MLLQSQADSLQYRFAYEIRAMADVPWDFPFPLPIDECCSIIFMPGDTQEAGQKSYYPPRIYLLTRDTFAVYPHPSADEPPFLISLEDLIEVSSERALLYGALQLHSSTTSKNFQYNAAHHKYVASLLRKVRLIWLPPCRMRVPTVALPGRDRPVDFRCQCAAEAELDIGEQVHKYCLQPQREKNIEGWIFRRTQVLPAIFLILTNRRIMAISTSKGTTEDQYGIALRYTAVGNLSGASIEQAPDGFEFNLEIKHSRTWRLFFGNEQISSVTAILSLLNESLPVFHESPRLSPT